MATQGRKNRKKERGEWEEERSGKTTAKRRRQKKETKAVGKSWTTGHADEQGYKGGRTWNPKTYAPE